MSPFPLPFAAACAAVLAAGPVLAQDLTPKAAPQSRPVVLRGATIHTVSGPVLLGGTLVFENGVIQGIHDRTVDVAIPDDAEVVDARGKHVYPGLIVTSTTMGLEEISQVPQSVDTREVGDLNPEVRAAVAVNPDSTVIPVNRTGGILTMGVFPQGGIVPGRVSVMSLDGWTWEDMTIEGDAGLAVNWPWNEDDIEPLDRMIEEARAWHDARRADPDIPMDIQKAALGKVLRREAPVFVEANGIDAIEQAASWAQRHELRLVIVGGRDAHLCTELLQRQSIAVVIGGTHNLPKRRDSAYDEAFRLPALLEEAGVTWCLTSGGSFYNERNLPFHAATAATFGLDRETALRAITLTPARILGVADRVGSLETGLDATLLVTDGSPLDLTTTIEMAFIQGRRVDLRNKQTELARKYREKYRQRGLIR